MVKLFKNTFTILTRQQNNILSAASVIMTAVALSRILGLIRDRLLAARFTPNELGVYYAAFRLPNMIFELLVMGALATAFIPVFTTYVDTKGKEEAFKMAAIVINIGLILFGVLSIPILVFTKEVSFLLAPGFSQSQIELMAAFTRIMILAQVFPLIIGNFLTGILQSYRNFLIPSLAPVVYNLGLLPLWLQPIFYLNPITAIIESFHWSLFQQPPALKEYWIISLIISLFCMGLGVLVFNKESRFFDDWI